MAATIPLSEPCLNGNEWKYVKECLDTGWVSSAGPALERFENAVCSYTGAAHAIACVNGTAALHIALILAGVQPGEEVVVPSVTFIAPVNCVRYAGARPVFMDCDDFYNIDAAKTAEFLREHVVARRGGAYNKKTGRRIRALIAVHVLGNAVDIEPLYSVCREYGIALIEDATESLGTRYTSGKFAGKHTGTIGDFGVFSFNGNKIITTGGGGMLLARTPAAARRARYLVNQAKDDGSRYIHHSVGYNYRLTNIQAALGIAQMEQLPRFVQRKRSNYLLYKKAVDAIDGLHLADAPVYADNNMWMYALQVDARRYGRGPLELMSELSSKGIQTRPLWHLNHLQRPYRKYQSYKIKKAGDMLKKTLMLPCSVGLTKSDIHRVVKTLSAIAGVHSRMSTLSLRGLRSRTKQS